jgi:protein involved in temperature-dependent protein secretion
MLLSDDRGMNYHDMVVVKQLGGRIRVVDIYVYLSAEMISSTMRRTYISIAASQNKSILEKLSGKEKEFAEHFREFARMAALLRSKQFRRATQIYDRLPKSLQKDKNVLILRLLASQEVSDEEYVKAIDAFRRHHPNDPCVDIMSIDRNILDEKYDDALDSVGRIDKSVGGDPYLDVLRANLLFLKEDFPLAKKRAQRAIKAEPTLISAQWVLVNLSLIEGEFDETTRLLNVINEKFEVEFEDLTTVPEYSEYVRSPQHKKWLESRKEK